MLMLAAAVAMAPDLHLTCPGTGVVETHDVSTGYIQSSNGTSVSGAVSTPQQRSLDDVVDVEIVSGKGRVKLPSWLGAGHSSTQGWLDIRDLIVTDNDITGKIAINFMAHPPIIIDRRSGRLTVIGQAHAFVGTCQKADPAAPKAF